MAKIHFCPKEISNRLITLGMNLILILGLTGFCKSAPAQSIRPVSLLCEYQDNPVGIDILNPAFSWLLEPASPKLRGLKQTTYEVMVASSLKTLSNDKGDLWNSGLVRTDRNTQVIYSGKPLKSHTKYFWKVRIMDNDGKVSKWSEVANWETGLFKREDWKGSWIGSKVLPDRKPRFRINGYHSNYSTKQDDIKWIQLDLGKITPFDKIILHPALPMEYPDGKTTIRNPGFGFPLRFRIDISDNPGFEHYTTIADRTNNDITNPGYNPASFDCPGRKSRYVRVTATRLWNCKRGAQPYCFCLGEMQVFSDKKNVSSNKPATALDSQENFGWSKDNLTDGLNVVGEVEQFHEAVLLRKETETVKKIRSATACICGLGYYELYINGDKAGDHVLDPGFTDYSKRALYVSYDVSDQLKEGRNAIGIILGGGWYDLATPDAWGFHLAPWNAPPKVLLNIELTFTDGSRETFATDSTWKFSTGPIVFNCVRGGEIYDATKEIPGWNLPGYDDSGWNSVKIVPSPAGILVAQQNPPIRATKTILPIGLTQPLAGIYVYDLGVNMAGWVRLEIKGEKGDTVSLFYNEQLNQDGTVLCGPHSWWTYGPYQTDKYICKGNGKEIFEPRFTYHGFRYVQVEGLKKKPLLDHMKGIFVHTDPAIAGKFSCGNPDINKVHELIIRTQLNNLHSIPTDCPHREKIGWMGDGLVTMEEAICNFDMTTFYVKWFHDMLDAQEPDGHVPPIVPNPGWIEATSAKNPKDVMPAFSDPWWGGAVIMVPWNLYQYYGDSRYLAEGYNAMKAYVDWIGTRSKDYIFKANLGDWIEPAMFSGAKITPKEQIGTSAYFYFARLMGQIAILLDKPGDSEIFNQLANNICKKYNQEFFNDATGLYADDSQLAQVMPLLFKMVPQGNEKLVEDQLISNIIKKRNNHLSTGFIGTPLLFKLLTELGYADLVYTMATREDQPGWFYMLRNGATTIWEVWDAMAQVDHSRDHPAFGAVGAWYYHSLAGIQPDPEGPGFKKIIIKPEIVGNLDWANASYHSIHGLIVCEWKKAAGKFFLTITVPVNTTASVYIPADKLNSIFEGDHPVGQTAHITYMRKENDKYVFKVGSGTYSFRSEYHKR